MKPQPLSALLLTLVAATALAQGAYRWVGKDGKVHYSDEPPPPAESQKVERRRLDASVVSGDKYSYAARQAAADFPVTLYLSRECGDGCKAARNFLARRGIPYAEKIVATPEDTATFREATKSEMLPTLLVGSRAEKGFEETAWGAALDAAGYPPAKP